MSKPCIYRRYEIIPDSVNDEGLVIPYSEEDGFIPFRRPKFKRIDMTLEEKKKFDDANE